MDVEEAIQKRRSVRSYQDKEIPKNKLERVLNAARMAPSAKNKQDWKFIVAKDEEKRIELYEAARQQSFVKEAPVVIAGVATDPEYKMGCDIPGGIVDLSIALDHLTLQAAEEGLGTCWVGAFDQEKAKEILNVPKGCEIVSLMPMGFPKEPLEKRNKRRKSLSEVISYDTYAD